MTGIGPDCSATSLPFDDPDLDPAMLRVMDDFAGGLVYQTDRNAILWLESGADRPVVVASVDDPGAESVTIEDIVVVDGAVELWFSRWRGLDWEDSDDIEHVVQSLERVVIDGGQAIEVAQIGGWESDTAVTVGGDTVGIENWAEGFYAFAVTDFEMERVPQPWNPYDPIEPQGVGCEGCPTRLVVSDDGSRAVFLTPVAQEAMILPALVVIDLGSGEEVSRIEVSGFGWPLSSPAEGPDITMIDILGDLVLINGADEGQLFPAIWADLGADEPVWEALPVPGSARFLRSDVP
jgi:hypothetical protein